MSNALKVQRPKKIIIGLKNKVKSCFLKEFREVGFDNDV